MTVNVTPNARADSLWADRSGVLGFVGYGAWQKYSSSLTCSILQRGFRQVSSTQGWYMPSVMQFSKMTKMEMRSNHVHESRVELNS